MQADCSAHSVRSPYRHVRSCRDALQRFAKAQNLGKPPRYHIDNWEDMMMRRDERLTGHRRGQTDNPAAPPGFETSSVWYTERAT
ncbi:putative small secreted protein [Lyophyllum shimeji]|uniref:NADH dehydrogenase [ubiquinone] 1 alpha subcomplex subunit 1 n=1 Tax=Lyophyllum shimeji TaxID=47721 RepID=A0A9P3UHL5_LYOSH|nr:putative small secreted protein [Lyophyllum shimeji]